LGKWLNIVIAGIVAVNALSSVYFKAGELSEYAIINEYTMSLLMSMDDDPITASDMEFLWDNGIVPHTYDAQIYDNQYDDSSKIPAIPFPAVLITDISKQHQGLIASSPFVSIQYEPPPPTPPPV